MIIHGHFYQPPREDPWTKQVPVEPTAAPYHDWNERIEAECYGPLVAFLEFLSFDFGPTLMRWLERHASDTYAGVLEADRQSRRRFDGHGNATAAPYHHIILPLAPRRDKVTEVRWGIADFRSRFGREPEGMWLPEAAVDDETLDVLAGEGIAFAIVGPGQVVRAPDAGWPGEYRTRTGRSIALFVYDGATSHDVAFGPLLEEPAAWAERLAPSGEPVPGLAPSGGHDPGLAPSGAPGPRLTSIATDGETYGHHHKSGVTALAAVLEILARREDVWVENFASFLARHAPRQRVELIEPSSWSCAHGVERWRSDCGCKLAPEKESQQHWRRPLREALEWLAGELHGVFEREGKPLFGDPWAARDAFDHPGPDSGKARVLLEMERDILSAFTSCAWFFDDLTGLETAQSLRYAAHAIDQVALVASPEERERIEAGFRERLARAPANDPDVGDGASFYLTRVRRAVGSDERG